MPLGNPASGADEVIVRAFQPGDAPTFRSLNAQWIERYFKLEGKDEAVFSDPQQTILTPGGQILFAIVGGTAVGCCALLRMRDGEFEVARMAVADEYQGNGIGRKLLCAAIEQAKCMQARRLYLETNHILKPAIRLYESLGFRRLDPSELASSPYARSDVCMELILS